MNTKDELFEHLRDAQVGARLTVTGENMSAVFGVDVNLSVVKAWLNEIGLIGLEVRDDGRGTTMAWVFERGSKG
jgi:hypothetical protein